MTSPLISYTIFPDTLAQSKFDRIDVPWPELVQHIHGAKTYPAKFACPLISLAEYGDSRTDANALRHQGNVTRVHGVEIDYDGEEVAPAEAVEMLQAANIETVIYTSPSHTPDKPRWRVLAPLSHPEAPGQRAELVGRLNRVLCGIAAKESFTLAQSFYIGRVQGASYEVHETHGRCIDEAIDIEPLYPDGVKPGATERPKPASVDADPILTALQERGLYVGEISAGKHEIACPWENEHTTEGGRGDTVVYQPNYGGFRGHGFRCLHGHCAGRTIMDVRRFLGLVNGEAHHDDIDDPARFDRTGEQLERVDTPDPPAAPRYWMDWPALSGRMPPPRTWRMAGWITTGPMLISGRGGIGKTLLAQQIGTALALGRPFIDKVTEPLKVLMWACEDEHDELWRRQMDICRWLDIGLPALAGRFTIEPRLGLDNTLFAPVYGVPTWTPLLRQLAEQANDLDADIVIVDNIGQTFGCNENSRHDVTAFVNGGIGIRRGLPFTLCLLGHPAKAHGSEFSGSTAWENAVRMRWYLGSTLPDRPDSEADGAADPNVRYLAKRKANYSDQDWRRLTYRDGVLAPDTVASGHRYDSSARKEIAEAIVLKGLHRLLGISMDTTPSANSPDYLPRKLIEMRFAEDATQAELRTALNAMLADGRIVIDTTKGSDRHPRKVLRPGNAAGSECGK